MIHFLLQAEADGKKVRALIVINPGNPTGGVLSKANQVDVVRFAEQNNMVLIADEVYATNVYAGAQSRHAMALRQYCQYNCRRLCCHIANVNSARGPVALRHREPEVVFRNRLQIRRQHEGWSAFCLELCNRNCKALHLTKPCRTVLGAGPP